MIELLLLGPTELRRDGDEIHSFLAGPKRLGLLVYLVLARPRGYRRRDAILPLFWPERGQGAARNALSNMLFHIRRELGEGVVENRGAEEIGVHWEALGCDVLAFEEALERGDREGALEWYRGELLEGFHVPGGSPDLSHWLDRERTRLRSAAAEAAWELAAGASSSESTVAKRWATRAAAFTPFSDAAHARLITLLHEIGDRAAALDIYDAFASRLRQEWDIAPSPEVRAAVEAVRGSSGGESGTREAGAAAAGRAGRGSSRAIAVLPFERVGGGPATSFTEGIQGDLLTRLSAISELQVISRTSTRRYRGTDRSMPEIAAELNVGWVVEGEVQETPGEVHLNVRLVNARMDRQTWARDYRRALSARNLFEIQGEVARAIGHALEATLSPDEERRIERRPTEDLEAYRLYGLGRANLDQRTEDGIRRALGYFRRAVAQDPDYALAWAGLTDALSLFLFYGFPLPDDAPEPMAAARRAAAVGADVGEAQAAMGILRSVRQEGPAALRALRRAVELAPSYAEGWIWLGWVHLCMGDAALAPDPARRAVELNPLAPAFRVYLAEILLANGRTDEALHQARRAREIQPGYGLAHYMEGLVRYHDDDIPAAVHALEQALALVPAGGTPTHGEVRALLALARLAAEHDDQARTVADGIDPELDPFSAGLVHAAFEDPDRAFASFDRVRRWSSHSVEHVRYFFPRVLGPLRSDPRYRRMLESVDRAWRGGPEAGD